MLYFDTGIETVNAVAPPCPPPPDSLPVRSEGLDSHFTAGKSRMVKAREHLFTAGDARCHVYRIESGSVCLYKIMPDGCRQVFDFPCAGEYVGLGSGIEHACNARALEPLRVKCIAVADLNLNAERNPRLAVELYEAMSRELMASQNHLCTIGQLSAAERVACFLLALSRRGARRGEEARTLVLPMSRSDIADFLSLTIETVSRTLSKLRADRLIDIEQHTNVRLLDTGEFERLAAGEAAVQPARVTRLRERHMP